MVKTRLQYFIIVMLVMLLGLASRHFRTFPLWPGDVLWALMVFYIVRCMFIRLKLPFIVALSLGFCYLIEISQLYQEPWINNIRHTLIGGLVLGFVFSWGDMLSYTIGIGLGIITEVVIIKSN